MTDQIGRLQQALADRYAIERQIGAGGMATVYLAEDIKHHRKVAIKVLREDLAAALGSSRFLREIQIAAALQHPNILPLLDSGEAGGFLYYVMPYVAGQSLRERLAKEGELPIAEAVRLISEVVDALAHAHENGVVHRDIKPDNVMLSGRHALVTDFGVAKAVSEASGRQTITTLGVALGTPAYMSPEQAAADPHVDHRSDIYSTGIMAYEMLAGRTPFAGTTPQQMLAAHVNEQPDPVSRRRPGVAPALEQVVMRCLAKRAADRWQTAQELLAQLEPFATPSGGTTPTGMRPATMPASGRRGAWLLVVGLAAAGVVAAVILTRRAPPTITLGAATQVTGEPGLEVMPAISPDGKTIAYAAGTVVRMRLFIRSLNGARTIPLTDDTTAIETEPHWSPDGESVLFLSRGGVFVAPKLGGQARPLIPATERAAVTSAAWSPDGREVAFVRRDSLFAFGVQGATVRFLAHGYQLRLCDWSRHGGLIACAAGNASYVGLGSAFGNGVASRIVVVPVTGGEPVAVTDSTHLNQSPAWGPDGRHLYYVSDHLGARDIFVLPVSRQGRPEGSPTRLTVGLGAQSISLSADGLRIAYSLFSTDENFWAVPIPTGAPVSASAAVAITSGSQGVNFGRVSHDQKWLLYSVNQPGNASIYRIATTGGAPERLAADSADMLYPDLSPNGKEVAFYSLRTGSRDVFVLPLNGGQLQQITSSPLQERLPSWSPDGSALAFYESTEVKGYIVRRGADGRWGKPVVRTTGISDPVAWSPDGRFLLGTHAGSVMIVPVDSGAPRTLYAPRASSDDPLAERPNWSPDGRTIYFKSHDALGRASIWSMPAAGGRPRLLVFFDDLTRPSTRGDWTTDGKRFYYVVNNRQSDIWVVELNKQ